MSFWQTILKILDADMPQPGMYGWFHLLFLGLTVLLAVVLSAHYRGCTSDQMRRMILLVSIAVVVLEVYKQINFSFDYASGITFDFQWYAFPFQFCSTPMYVGLLAGLTRKGKLHDAANAYLATYALFAGVCVMVYPSTVFVETIGINVQTMICHGSMIVVGVCLLASGIVKLEHKTILKALPAFAVCVLLAWAMNEVAYRVGLLETETFNMFFISPYCEPSLPVYSLVQAVVPFPLCLVIYVAGFSVAAYLMLLIAMGVRALSSTRHKHMPVANV